MNPTSVLSIPGYNGAGPSHWLSQWERQASPKIVRVEQKDWTICDPIKWIETLETAVLSCSHAPFFLAHSMGCLTVAKWAAESKNTVAGAMLVAPPDVDAPATVKALQTFRPVPLAALPFPTVVVASSNDPYCSLDRARLFATEWGADFVNLGAAGHIETTDGFGEWKKGLELLNQRLSL
ncbi:alpha/beta hydrolase [Alphaproteobacteria bacterium]|nr:alpha/beta hydrolase [Alphaproteobacteria bacterium]